MTRKYTVYCKLPSDKRGEYSEEIDITTTRRLYPTAVKRLAQKVIDRDYDPELRPVRVVERVGLWF